MKVINITEEQKNNLSKELAKLVFELKKDDDVECIYFSPYKGLGSISGKVLEVTLVKKSSGGKADINEFFKRDKRNKYYLEEDSLRKFGVKIVLDADDAHRYTFIDDLNNIDDLSRTDIVKFNSLFNSTILFDRTGKYKEIKKQKIQDKQITLPYENLALIVPPIINETYKSMERIQNKKDSEAVKKFTKSSIFQIFKDMK